MARFSSSFPLVRIRSLSTTPPYRYTFSAILQCTRVGIYYVQHEFSLLSNYSQKLRPFSLFLFLSLSLSLLLRKLFLELTFLVYPTLKITKCSHRSFPFLWAALQPFFSNPFPLSYPPNTPQSSFLILPLTSRTKTYFLILLPGHLLHILLLSIRLLKQNIIIHLGSCIQNMGLISFEWFTLFVPWLAILAITFFHTSKIRRAGGGIVLIVMTLFGFRPLPSRFFFSFRLFFCISPITPYFYFGFLYLVFYR